MQIGITYDHNGYQIAQKVKEHLLEQGYKVKDYNNKYDPNDDYPKEALKLLEHKEKEEIGILICGSGVGMSIIANKVKGIRCARVLNKEEAIETRTHQDANVLALSAKTPNIISIIDAFLETPFSNEERHIRRIKEIEKYEEKVMKWKKYSHP